MILSPQQVRRLFAILDPLTEYANARLDSVEPTALRGAGLPGLDPDLQAQVLFELWENRNIIDDFVMQNPAGLDSMQLLLVRQWRGSLSGVFTAWRFPDGVLRFIGDGYAFEVCGISREIEGMLNDIPAIVRMTLLPFEGRIVYAEAISEMPVAMGEGMLEVIREDAAKMLAEGRAISTASELMRVLPEIREKELRRETERMLEDLEDLETPEPDRGDGWHRGVLAGMPYEDREKAVMAVVHGDMDSGSSLSEHFLEMLEERCTKGEPTADMAEALGRHTKDRLAGISRAAGIDVPTSWRKAQVVEALGDWLRDDGVVSAIHSMRPQEIASLRSLFEAGGRRSLADTGIASLAGFPTVVVGLCNLFHHDGEFVFQIPDEVMALLRGFDWDAAMAEAKERQNVLKVAEDIVELRGIVRLAEFVEEYARLSPRGFSPQDALDTLVEAIEVDEASCHMLSTTEEVYLLHFELAYDYLRNRGAEHPYDEDPFMEGELDAELRQLLKAQQGKPPRALDQAILAEESVFHWKEKSAPVQAMREFLDAHVPDDANDYYYADKVIEDILEEQKWGLNGASFQPFADIMEEDGVVLDERLLRRFIELLMGVVNGLPNWPNNGWAPNELASRGSGAAFFNEDGSPVKVGRNDPCPCGSGKKYKKCHGRPGGMA